MHTLTEREVCDHCYRDFADWHMTISHLVDDDDHSHSYSVCNACVVDYFLMIEVQKIQDEKLARDRKRRDRYN